LSAHIDKVPFRSIFTYDGYFVILLIP
jgi:hypothetical protein